MALWVHVFKKSRQNLKYLEDEKSFADEIKSCFHHFKDLSVLKNCLRLEIAALIHTVFCFMNLRIY